MQVLFEDMSTRLFSPKVWAGLAPPAGLSAMGSSFMSASGNPAFGFFDDFLFHDTTSGDGYGKLLTSSTIAQIASTAGVPGILRFNCNADNDQAVLQGGNILDVGPYLLQKDFAFECRVRMDAEAIVAGDHGYFIGMATGGSAGACVSDLLFTTGDAIYATADFVGFQHLVAESTALDAMYQASGQTKVDGAVNTALDTVHTLVAATWVKLGFRFRATRPRSLEWYVNGVLKARIGETAIAAAAFPDADTAFMQPTLGIRGVDSTDMTIDMDWWAAAQYE